MTATQPESRYQYRFQRETTAEWVEIPIPAPEQDEQAERLAALLRDRGLDPDALE